MTTTYSEIPAGRLPILDYTSRLGDEGHIGVLAVALAEWAARSDDRPDADARRAANRAMDALDAALAELYELRSLLVGEIRESDDQAAVRVDAIARPVQGGTTMSDSPHDHARPGLAEQRATLAVARAVLNSDPAAAHDAAGTGSCEACTVICAIQLGFSLVAQFTGQRMVVTEPLRLQLAAVIDAAQAELDSSAN